jgi:hypothetical protein
MQWRHSPEPRSGGADGAAPAADNDESGAWLAADGRTLWLGILKRAGVADDEAKAIAARARMNGVALPIEAIVSGATS